METSLLLPLSFSPPLGGLEHWIFFSWFNMPWLFSSLVPRFRLWLRDHGRLQELAILLLYVQIGCSMVGSLGALFNGILLVNMVVALFVLVVLEISSQILAKTYYTVLLTCMIFLDAAWVVFFSGTIWNFSYDENYGPFFVFLLRLAFSMQIFGFSVRILSSVLWIQMYRLEPLSWSSVPHHVSFYRRVLIGPSTEDMTRRNSMSNIFGSCVRIASPYAPPFEDAQDKGYASEVEPVSGLAGMPESGLRGSSW